MPGYEYVHSVLRALDILAVVGSSDRGVPLHYLARGLDLNLKTAHSLVRTLVHRGFLEKTSPPPRYRLGPVMSALREREGQWVQEVLMPAIPWCIRMSRRMRAQVMLSGYMGGKVLGRFTSRVKESELLTDTCLFPMPAYGSAVAYQAFMQEPDLADYRATHRLGESSLEYWGSVELVDRLLVRVRAEGHLAFVMSGVFRAAAPILGGGKTARAMISLTKPFHELGSGDAQECIDLIRQAANELSFKTSPVQPENFIGAV